jgi:hypothetical protein
MTPKQKILRNTKTLRESVRPDVVELAKEFWSDHERKQIRDYAALCVLDLNELIERLHHVCPAGEEAAFSPKRRRRKKSRAHTDPDGGEKARAG